MQKKNYQKIYSRVFWSSIGVFVLLIGPLITRAAVSLSLTEIMYDAPGTDTGYEWVEIYNGTGSGVDISNWKFFENNTNHGLVPVGTSSIISAGGYAILTTDTDKFLSVYPTFSGLLIDTSWSSLSNAGETIAIKNEAGDIVDTSTYDTAIGAAGDGNSLQKNNTGSWIAASPTPGKSFTDSNTTGTGSSGNTTSTETQQAGSDSALPKTTKEATPPTISMKFSAPRNAYVGIPIDIKTIVYGYNQETRERGSFLWNFGDGNVKESDWSIPEFSYTYETPGTYYLYAEYRLNPYTDKAETSTGITVTVQSADIVIKNIDMQGSIYIKNTSDDTIDLSGWGIMTEKAVYQFPRKTFIVGGSTLVLTENIHHLFVGPSDKVQILLPNKEVQYTFNQKPEISMQQRVSSGRNNLDKISSQEVTTSTVTDLSDASGALAVQATSGAVLPEWLYYVIGMFLVAIIAVAGIFYTRHKETTVSSQETVDDEYDIEELED